MSIVFCHVYWRNTYHVTPLLLSGIQRNPAIAIPVLLISGAKYAGLLAKPAAVKVFQDAGAHPSSVISVWGASHTDATRERQITISKHFERVMQYGLVVSR